MFFVKKIVCFQKLQTPMRVVIGQWATARGVHALAEH